MSKILYLKEDNQSVFLKYIDNQKMCKYYKLNSKNIVLKVLKKIGHASILWGDWKNKVKDCELVILGENGYFPSISKYIKKNNPNCKIILYFWNILKEQKSYSKLLDDKNIDEFWTFDKIDAKKYNMKYNPQFYTKNVKIKKNNNKYDVLFLGRAKTRKNELMNIEEEFRKYGINTNFKVIEKEKDYVAYDDYLDMLSESKCVLDYNQEGQVGLSLRPMEALFLRKKLITNNSDIKNYDFYDDNNIFILGENNIKELKEFINKPYKKINQDIIDYYDFEQWLKRFGV